MRSIAQIETELRLAKRIATADPGKLGPSRDNDGRIVAEPEERRASARRQVERLTAELDALRAVVAKGIPPYGDADEAAAQRVLVLARDQGMSEVALLREIAGAVATARREGGEAALAPFHALFSGEPDTPCRTTYRVTPLVAPEYLEVECVEVPLDEVRSTFEEAERAIEGVA